MRMIEKVSPETAADIRAQAWQITMDAADRQTGRLFGAEMVKGGLKPQTFKNAIGKRERLLFDLYKGDPKAMQHVKETLEAFDRLSLGPGYEGSDTLPKALMTGFSEMGGKMGGGDIAGLAKAITGKLKEKRMSPEDLYQVMSSSEGAETMAAIVKPLAMSMKGKMVRAMVMRRALAAVGRLGAYTTLEPTPRGPAATLQENQLTDQSGNLYTVEVER